MGCTGCDVNAARAADLAMNWQFSGEIRRKTDRECKGKIQKEKSGNGNFVDLQFKRRSKFWGGANVNFSVGAKAGELVR